MLVSLPMEVRDSISHSSGDSHPLFSETGSSTTVEHREDAWQSGMQRN